MREAFLFAIQAPARLVGALVGQFWVVAVVLAAGGLAYLAYQLVGPETRPRIAKGLAAVVFIYAALVGYEAQKWTALSMLEHYRGDVD